MGGNAFVCIIGFLLRYGWIPMWNYHCSFCTMSRFYQGRCWCLFYTILLFLGFTVVWKASFECTMSSAFYLLNSAFLVSRTDVRYPVARSCFLPLWCEDYLVYHRSWLASLFAFQVFLGQVSGLLELKVIGDLGLRARIL
ncbi:hypothetical protein V8F20_002186 [Naviculisporaceae sp. PSN 640]